MSRVTRSPSRPPSGFPAYAPTDLPVYRGGGSSFTPLSLSPISWVRTPAPPAAPACSITLDGTAFAGLGVAPADVSGQTASVTGAAAGSYGAGTDARPMPTSGIVWVSSKDMAYSGTFLVNAASLIIVAYDASNDPIGYVYFSTDGTDHAVGINTSPFLGPFTGVTGGTIGVGHDGEVYAYDRGASAIVKASDIDPGFAGIFASAVTLKAGVLIDSSTTVTASVTVVTSQSDMVDLAGIAGTGEDWCGNAIGVPVPGLYQDSAGTTPVTGAGQDVGKRVDQSGNGNDWTQVTGTARPTYDGTALVYDADDALVMTVPSGGLSGTFVQATTEGVTVGTYSRAAGAYQMPVDTLYPLSVQNDVGQLYFDRVLSAGEIAQLVQWLKDNEGAGTDVYTGSWGTRFRNRADITSFDVGHWDTSAVTAFNGAWFGCSGLTYFPLLDVSGATIFNNAWTGCSGLTSFPLLDVSGATNFSGAWLNCSGLTSFPANFFDGCAATIFNNAFTNTNLTQTSIDNILVSINSNGTSNGTFNQSGGSAPSATGEAAIDAMRLRGWTVTVTGGY